MSEANFFPFIYDRCINNLKVKLSSGVLVSGDLIVKRFLVIEFLRRHFRINKFDARKVLKELEYLGYLECVNKKNIKIFF